MPVYIAGEIFFVSSVVVRAVNYANSISIRRNIYIHDSTATLAIVSQDQALLAGLLWCNTSWQCRAWRLTLTRCLCIWNSWYGVGLLRSHSRNIHSTGVWHWILWIGHWGVETVSELRQRIEWQSKRSPRNELHIGKCVHGAQERLEESHRVEESEWVRSLWLSCTREWRNARPWSEHSHDVIHHTGAHVQHGGRKLLKCLKSLEWLDWLLVLLLVLLELLESRIRQQWSRESWLCQCTAPNALRKYKFFCDKNNDYVDHNVDILKFTHHKTQYRYRLHSVKASMKTLCV